MGILASICHDNPFLMLSLCVMYSNRNGIPYEQFCRHLFSVINSSIYCFVMPAAWNRLFDIFCCRPLCSIDHVDTHDFINESKPISKLDNEQKMRAWLFAIHTQCSRWWGLRHSTRQASIPEQRSGKVCFVTKYMLSNACGLPDAHNWVVKLFVNAFQGFETSAWQQESLPSMNTYTISAWKFTALSLRSNHVHPFYPSNGIKHQINHLKSYIIYW